MANKKSVSLQKVVCYLESASEKDEVKARAAVAGLTVSEYARRRMLGHAITNINHLTLANEIRQVGLALKDLVREHGYASAQVLETMLGIQSALSGIE